MPRYSINDIWQLIFNTYSKSLRMIELGVSLVIRGEETATTPTVIDVSAISANKDLFSSRNYRLISNVDAWVKFAVTGTPVAIADIDIYIPADKEFKFNSKDFTKIAAIAGGAGKLQYVEIN